MTNYITAFPIDCCTVHRDTLQFVHDKLVNAPTGVEAREKNRVAMAQNIRTDCGVPGAAQREALV